MTVSYASTNRELRNYWWVLLLQGCAALLFGLVLLFQPGATLVVLTTFMGAYWLVDGIFKVVGAFTGQRGDRSWWMLLLSGLLGIVGGLIVLGQPLFSTVITQLFSLYILAIQAIIGGVLSIVWAVQVRNVIKAEGWIIAGGILAILLGVMLFVAPFASIILLARLTAILAILGGISLIVMGFRWRSAA